MTTPMLIIILFFISFFVGLMALYIGYASIRESPSYKLKMRLMEMAQRSDDRLPIDVAKEILQEASPVDKFLYKFKLIKRLDHLIDNAGLDLNVKIFVMIIAFAAVVGLFFGMVIGRGILVALILLVIFGAIPIIYLKQKKNKRIQRFTEQFPDALDMIARSLRAGHSLSSAIEMIGKEMGEPVSGLFKTAYEEQTLGLSIRDALARMLDRMESMDLRLFITAINIHREVGGNLAEMLERLGTTIRDRLRIRRQIRVYTAQGRLSGYILAILPIFMAVALYTLSPDYIKELWIEKSGRYAIIFALIAQIFGFIVIKRLINIRI